MLTVVVFFQHWQAAAWLCTSVWIFLKLGFKELRLRRVFLPTLTRERVGSGHRGYCCRCLMFSATCRCVVGARIVLCWFEYNVIGFHRGGGCSPGLCCPVSVFIPHVRSYLRAAHARHAFDLLRTQRPVSLFLQVRRNAFQSPGSPHCHVR